jgi:hypothetical protein
MYKLFAACIFYFFSAVAVNAQDTLPSITVKNISGQIIVSWINGYKMPVANISIQRSFDSLKNYTTIGSVLNPQNIENGYADVKPPYNKMYYRVFVSFEGGTYLFSKIVRPVKEIVMTAEPVAAVTDSITAKPAEDPFNPFLVKDNWIAKPNMEAKAKNGGIQPKLQLPKLETNTEVITYPSRRIFTNKDNAVTIILPDAEIKKYMIKFFDENEVFLFELTKITESYLIIEKVNFKHAGWFHFEVYESGKLVEKNKFYVPKDGKNQQPPPGGK